VPIKNLTDTVRLPRLGKIHLGTRHPEKGYPQKADHFVFPKDHSDYDKLVEIYGEQPKELKVLIPVEDEEMWATTYYKAYNQTYGLVCKGDGELALRMIDTGTGSLPDAKKPGTVTMKEIPCLGKDCPDYQAKKCRETMNLRFILPEVPGLGIWQIDTSSKNSIININSCSKIIKRAFGRVSMIPLKLTFEPIHVNNPETGKKQTVYVLNLRTDVTLAQLADAAREQAKMFLLEEADLEQVYELETEKIINDLWDGKPAPEPEPTQETPPDDTRKESESIKDETNTDLLVWLKESLQTIQSKGKVAKWSNKAVVERLNEITGVQARDVVHAVKALNKEQAESFVKEVQETLSMM